MKPNPKDSLGNRMKFFEQLGGNEKTLLPMLPAIARLDGRSFSKLTKKFERPYDLRLSKLMQECTKFLVEETVACVGYTQSDEITLIWDSNEFDKPVFFNGRIAKMNSILAAMLSVYFNEKLPEFFSPIPKGRPIFDCRVWNVPNKKEACNTLIWRELDASKNSISMAAQSMFIHTELHKKSGKEKQEMMFQKENVNWNDYPDFFKKGSYYQNRTTASTFSAEELDALPPKHAARTNPQLEVRRKAITELQMPPFRKVANRVEVIFEQAEPILLSE